MHYLDYNEEKQHGTEDFPIEYYHVTKQHPRYDMPFHWHKETEIIRILEGTFSLYLDDESVSASAGDIIFINGGVIHGGVPSDCVYECIVFDLKALLRQTAAYNRYIRPITSHQIMVHSHFSPLNSPLTETVNHLFQVIQDQIPGKELFVIGFLYDFFGVIFSAQLYEIRDGRAEHNTKKILSLKPVLEYIDQNYDQTITLHDLSRLAGMSPKYFCRFFQTAIHRTPIDYLNYYRIERACSLLSTSEISITEAGFQCGFHDSSYFVKIFKKYKGVTPKQYCKI